MFCRFCGAAILPDSRFCSRCGKPVAAGSPRADAAVAKLRLKTPYPYALLVFMGFLVWALQPDHPPFDYSTVRLELELAGETSVPEQNLFRHHFSLIVENVGEGPIPEVPVEIRARVEPAEQAAQVESDFLGRRLVILSDGKAVPLVVYLTDPLAVGEKRRYSIDGIVTSTPPFNIVYEVAAEDSAEVLASFSTVIPAAPPEGGADGPTEDSASALGGFGSTR
jgi:hypothetical protein